MEDQAISKEKKWQGYDRHRFQWCIQWGLQLRDLSQGFSRECWFCIRVNDWRERSQRHVSALDWGWLRECIWFTKDRILSRTFFCTWLWKKPSSRIFISREIGQASRFNLGRFGYSEVRGRSILSWVPFLGLFGVISSQYYICVNILKILPSWIMIINPVPSLVAAVWCTNIGGLNEPTRLSLWLWLINISNTTDTSPAGIHVVQALVSGWWVR